MDLGERKGRIMSFFIENGEKSIHHSANSNIVLAKIKSDGFTGDMALLNSNRGKKGHRALENCSYSFKNSSSSSSRVILKV